MRATTGSRIPALTLPEAATGTTLSLRAGRGPLVMVATHGGGCADCVRQVEGLAEVADRIAEWGGRIVVVTPDAGERDGRNEVAALLEAAAEPVRVVADPSGRIASDAEEARVVIADEWGEVYFASESGSRHPSVSPGELLDWVKFVVIQCPECEGPEGEWRRMTGA